jgi:hypothetical protein
MGSLDLSLSTRIGLGTPPRFARPGAAFPFLGGTSCIYCIELSIDMQATRSKQAPMIPAPRAARRESAGQRVGIVPALDHGSDSSPVKVASLCTK